jgi:AcrR family transcriptional regulator
MRQIRAYCLSVVVVGGAVGNARRARPGAGPAGRDRRPAGERITDGALVCIARWGMAKTTLDDIARQAGCSRATIYRLFPGGKRAVLLATGEAELERLLAELAVDLEASTTLEELLVVGITHSVSALRGHPALQYLIDHEPGVVLAHVSFDALDPLLAVATAFGQPYLSRYLDPATAAATAEWVTRVIVSYGIVPCHDLADPVVATRFVQTFVLPGLVPTRPASPPPDRSTPDPRPPDLHLPI